MKECGEKLIWNTEQLNNDGIIKIYIFFIHVDQAVFCLLTETREEKT